MINTLLQVLTPPDRFSKHFGLTSTGCPTADDEQSTNTCSTLVPRQFYLPKVLDYTSFFWVEPLTSVIKVHLFSTLCRPCYQVFPFGQAS